MSTDHENLQPDYAALADVRAPASLHRSIERMIAADDARAGAPHRFHVQRFRLTFLGVPATALAVVLVLALALTGGSSSPTVPQASAFAMRAATSASPAENPTDRDQLVSSVDGIAYPYWGEGRHGWRTAGARTDTLGTHTITTVFYTNSRIQRIGYSIVSGSALPTPQGRVWKQAGVSFHLLNVSGTRVVTWERQGHTCILAGASVSPSTLLGLAARET